MILSSDSSLVLVGPTIYDDQRARRGARTLGPMLHLAVVIAPYVPSISSSVPWTLSSRLSPDLLRPNHSRLPTHPHTHVHHTLNVQHSRTHDPLVTDCSPPCSFHPPVPPNPSTSSHTAYPINPTLLSIRSHLRASVHPHASFLTMRITPTSNSCCFI